MNRFQIKQFVEDLNEDDLEYAKSIIVNKIIMINKRKQDIFKEYLGEEKYTFHEQKWRDTCSQIKSILIGDKPNEQS